MITNQWDTLYELIDTAKRIVFFGGAGVSTESGIADFRSATGIYSRGRQLSPAVVLSHDYFYRHPVEFYEFYFKHLVHPDAEPNVTHRWLAALEARGVLSAVITQNIDGLHQAAGSQRVLELHGSVHRNRCVDCGQQFNLTQLCEMRQKFHGVPHCPCQGLIKPDVVLYGEPLDEQVVQSSIQALSDADLLIVAGTSLVVYPAASVIDYYRGEQLVMINATATPRDDRASLVIRAKLGDVIRPHLAAMLNKRSQKNDD